MYAIFYIQHCNNEEIDFDQIFRFYRKMCFICATKDDLEHIKNQFLQWMETHDFSIDYSFNLIDDVYHHEHPWITQP